MATTLTSLYPMETSDEVLHRIPRIDWLEWFDGLEFRGAVDVLPVTDLAISGWVLDRADFDPFDDVLEILFSDGDDAIRLLLDAPREVLAATAGSVVLHLTILTADGPLVIRSAERNLTLRAS